MPRGRAPKVPKEAGRVGLEFTRPKQDRNSVYEHFLFSLFSYCIIIMLLEEKLEEHSTNCLLNNGMKIFLKEYFEAIISPLH